MKNILVPTDFSANSKDALVYALNFLKGEDAKIHVLSVLTMPPRAVGSTGSLALRMQENAREDMRKLLEEMKEQGVDFNPMIREGSTVNVILDVAEEVDAEAIIMGTKGSTGLESVILGSVASKVIEKSPYPVISVPAGSHFNGLKRVLYPSDFNKSTSGILKKMIKLTEAYNSRVDVLHIYPEGSEPPYAKLEQLENEVEAEMKDRKILFHAHPHTSIADGIVAFMDASETELLAMVTQRRNLIQKLFDRSLTKRIAMSSTVPLISFQSEE